MAQVSISDVALDPNNTFPSSGTMTFLLSGWFIDSAGKIRLTKSEVATVSAVDGTFTIALESTTDGVPASRTYSVSFTGVIEGVTVTQNLGEFQLPPSPTTVQLSDLLQAAITPIETGTAVYDESPSGSIDSSNKTFTLASTPIAGTVRVFLNGIRQLVTTQYTISGSTITFVDSPMIGSSIRVDYLMA